jgi:putative ABC transport system substrate-binding protein
MRRREFIAGYVGAVAWPLAARAQQVAKLPTIGFLGAGTPLAWGQWVTAFVQRLRELNWIEGRTVAIEYRWAEGERYAEIAAEFVRLKATAVIPIVFASAPDPLGLGLVASLRRPGGNVTGLSSQFTDLADKRLEFLRELLPGLRRLAIMANVDYPAAGQQMDQVAATSRALGLAVETLKIQRGEDIAAAFDTLKGADALYVVSDPIVNANRIRLNTLALGARLPTMHSIREYVEAGGLMSYGPNFPELWRHTANFVDKILRGTKPADIPVEQPTKFDLVVNLITAKALGLTMPASVLARADEVIE